MKKTLQLSVAILLILAAMLAVRFVTHRWFSEPGINPYCGVPQDAACIAEQASLFMRVDYPESKDLGKSFLTLLAAMLVASITFSEKIVDVQNASDLPVSTMVVCWLLLLVSIVGCGAGLALVTTAAGLCAYAPDRDYRLIELRGSLCFLAAGVTFTFSLIALIIAGVASLFQKRRAASKVKVGVAI